MYMIYVYYEIKKRLQSKGLILTELAIALLLIAGLLPLSAVISQETSRVDKFAVAIVDEEQSLYTQLFVGQILTSPSIQDNLYVTLIDRAEAEELLAQDKIAGMVIIPAIFTENMQAGIFTPLEIYLNSNMPLQARLIEEGMRSGAHLMSTVQNALFAVYAYSEQMAISEEELDMLFQSKMFVLISEALDRNQIYGRERKTPWADLTMQEYYMLSLPIILMSLYGCGIIINFHNDERGNVNNRLVLNNKSRFRISLGNAVASAFILFVQGMLIFLPICFINKTSSFDRYLSMLPLVFFISLQISLINMIIAVIVNNTSMASITSVFLSLFQAVLSGSVIPIYFLPAFLPGELRFFTLNFWWQHSLVSVYTSGKAEGFMVIIILVCAMIGVLRGVVYAKFETIYLYNAKRA